MPNLRIIYNNVADRATVTGNTAVSTLPATNMQNDYKGRACRSTLVSNSVVYNLTWTAQQTIGGVVLPCTNLSSSSTILVQAYSDSAWTTQINTGAVAIPACPGTSLQEWTRAGYSNSSINSNLFPYGALSKTSWWFGTQLTTVQSLKITLTDTANLAGYIDCSRIVCGQYWSPSYNVDRNNLVVGVEDSSIVSRTDNGDLLSEQGFVYDQLSFNLSVMTDTDRNTLIDIMRTYGVSKNILISIFPVDASSSANSKQEQIYTIYGKRDNSDISYLYPGLSSHGIKITGW